MFNLLISASDTSWEEADFELEANRFLEYTDEKLTSRYSDLERSLDEIRSLPSLFGHENGVDASARIGRILSADKHGRSITITYELDPSFPPISPDQFQSLHRFIDVGEFEANRTHWAIKKPALGEALRKAGIFDDEMRSRIPNSPLRIITRQTIIIASAILSNMGHTELDRLLLEWGIEGLEGGRELGGMLARSNAIAQFAVNNPFKRTSEGQTLDEALVKAALEIHNSNSNAHLNNVSPQHRASFQDGAHAAGFLDVRHEPSQHLDIEELSAAPSPKNAQEQRQMSIKHKVFLVHGRNDGAKDRVARFLERIGIEVVILHEQPNRGRSLISKFREEAEHIGFAVALMTADDVGGLNAAPVQPRARQNVVFELGFFIGKIGADKVCALVENGIERPSDFEAVVYLTYDTGTGWQTELARELHAAGIPFDPLKVIHL